jgi:HAD superfamily hydrolase (TIGR01549 family)
MQMITLFIDLDNTLFDELFYLDQALEKTLLLFKKKSNINDKKLYLLYTKTINNLKSTHNDSLPYYSRLLRFKYMCDELRISDRLFPLTLEEYFWNTFFENITLFDGAKDFLSWAQKYFQTCLLTNFYANIQYAKIKKLNIEKYIDFIVTSEEIGIEKSNPLIFVYALNKTKSSKKNAIMIGDNYEKDILGAQNVGIKTLHITPGNINPSKKGKFWFKNFFELQKYLMNAIYLQPSSFSQKFK